MTGASQLRPVLVLLCISCFSLQHCADSHQLAPETTLERPSWLGEPTVTGGSNQEPLIFRIRRGTNLTVHTEQDYLRTHTEEAILEVKGLGANFFMTHLFKAFGTQTEADEIRRAKDFSALLHRHGFRVGTYVGSTIAYETFLTEKPEAKKWLVDDYLGKPVVYGSTQYFRRRPYFGHPGYKQYIKEILRTGIQGIGTDLIHFDNPANQAVPEVFHHPLAVQEFREFLHTKYSPEELKQRIGFSNTAHLFPPRYVQPEKMQTFDDPVAQEWIDFRCQKLADHYRELAEFIRRQNSEVAVEINPHGITGANRAWESSVDFARLLPHVDFFWCEDGNSAGISDDGVLVSNIRSYKLARAFNNNVFNALRESALMVAENLAFNPHSLTRPDRTLKAYVDFYLSHYDECYRDTDTVAPVAVLRSFPSMAYNNFATHQSTILFEQALLQAHIPFDLVYTPHLEDLSKYDVLVLANQESLSQIHLDLIDRFVTNGGGLVATEDSSLYTEWRRRRPSLGLSHLLNVINPQDTKDAVRNEQTLRRGRTVYVPAIVPSMERPPSEAMKNRFWGLPLNFQELVDAVAWAANGPLPVEVEAPPTTLVELTANKFQPLMTLHFVNYEDNRTVTDIVVRLKLPDAGSVEAIEWRSPDPQKIESLSWKLENGLVVFSVPELEVYGLVSVRLAN